MAMTHYAPILGEYWRLIESYEVDPEPIFRKLNLDPALIHDIYARIPYSGIELLWQEMTAVIDDPAIGLKLSGFWHPSGSGPLGYAWLASSSLRTAFERVIRFLKVFTDGMSCRIEESDGKFVFVHSFHEQSLNIPCHVDAILSTLILLCRINYGKELNPELVQFTHDAPVNTGDFYAFFRSPVEFNASENSLLFPVDVVDKRLICSQPKLAQLNDQVMIEYLAKLDHGNIVEKVKAIILEQLPSGKITDSYVAENLYMTSRTLQRRLAVEGTSFKTLLNEVRKNLADQYISDNHLSINEISFLLGFSEISSFSRAFKRWNGSPPSDLRK